MNKEKIRQYKDLAFYSSIGLSVAFSIFIGLAMGIWLDGKMGTHPWMTLIFLIFGIIAGYRNIGLAIKKSRNL